MRGGEGEGEEEREEGDEGGRKRVGGGRLNEVGVGRRKLF